MWLFSRKAGARDVLRLHDDQGLVVVGSSVLWDNLGFLSLGRKPLCSQVSENKSAGHQESGGQIVPLIVGGNTAQVQPEAAGAVTSPPLSSTRMQL